MAQSKMPESAQLMLRNMQSRGHPWAGIQSMRLRGDWTSDLELKILAEGDNANTLFWVGCTGALVERNVKATLSMTRVLKAAGVDFAVLGDAETCCGDPARRAGYEFQFQIMAEQNIEIFKSYNIKEIITTCPHCYNTIKHEYPRYGGDFKVVHYTELIADLIRQGKLKLTNELNSKLTYHDPCHLGRGPCHLGRGLGSFDGTRDLLAEMEHHVRAAPGQATRLLAADMLSTATTPSPTPWP
jgi:Fe-S oxidoreductase